MRYSLLLAFLLLPFFAHAQSDASAELKATQERLKVLEDRFNKLDASPAKTSLSAFNPAMGLALDLGASHDQARKGRFQFRAAELNIQSAIDPFVKGFAIIVGSDGGVAVEEAGLQTTALPHNLTVSGGRLFASFGRLAHFHNHELPVIDRPVSLDTYIGGETQADGVEATYLFPTPFYLSATAGVFNKIGGGNARVVNANARPLDEFTYLGRLATYGDAAESHSVELGLSAAWTPKRTQIEDTVASGSVNRAITTRKNTWRALTGADLTYRYQPAAGGLYKGVVWSTEVMANNERRFDASRLPTDRVRAFSGFSYIQLKVGRKWRPGMMVDFAEDLDIAKRLSRTVTGFLTYDVTEFQRLRLAWAESNTNVASVNKNRTIGLQWTGVLGSHVHGFRDR